MNWLIAVSVSEDSLCPFYLSICSSDSNTLPGLLSLCVKFWNQILSIMTFVKAIFFTLISFAFLKDNQNQISDFKRRKANHDLFFPMEVTFHLHSILWTIDKSTIINDWVHSLISPFVCILFI